MNLQIPRGQLLRVLGVGFGIAVAVGEMIGSGILRTPSLVAAGVPMAAAILALWAFGAVHVLMQANVLAELATMLPRVGGQYVFVRRALGDMGGLVVGWTMWCAHIAGLAASSIAFADFLVPLWPAARGHEGGIAAGLQIALFGANILGLREGRALQGATTILKAALLLFFAAAAAWLVPAHIAAPSEHALPIGLLALAGAYQLIRGAYNGWHAPVYFAEENVTPGRSIPLALFFGIAFTATLYLLVNAALLRAVGVSAMAVGPLPFLIVLNRVAGGWAAALFAIGAMIAAASCANANVMIAPRVLFALARDRLLPAALEAVNSGGSPYFGFVLTATASIALAATGGFRLVFGLIATLVTLGSLLTEISFFVLRKREPALARPWRAIAYPWLPAFVIVIDSLLLVLFALTDIKGVLIAIALALFCVPFALIARRVAGSRA